MTTPISQQHVAAEAARVRSGSALGTEIQAFIDNGGGIAGGGAHPLDAINDLNAFVATDHAAVWALLEQMASELAAVRVELDLLKRSH